ncbi:MAG: sigma-70 family RNA polymerase sigma factor [Flavobacterium sp.]|nr:sigma-70 family RNA polymerase sigma factor [Pedobacter sp.]
MSKKINKSELVDAEIIIGIQKGSKDSLNSLYNSFYPMVLQFVLANNGDEDEAKDIFQESVIVLYNKVKSGGFELNSKLKTFIYSVCRRLWLKRLNQKSRNSASELRDFEEFQAVEYDLEFHQQKDAQFLQMEKALMHLGEPCRTIIEDYYIKNQSMQEITEKFGYTNADNAKTQKYKCLQRLKKLFFQP